MKKSLLALLLACLSYPVFAQQHEDFPEGTLLAMEGKDSITAKECFLFVMDLGFTGPEQKPEQFFAKVLTAYSHGQEVPAPIEIRSVAGRAGVLSGTGANGKDQIAVFLDPVHLDLKNIKSFNLKWLHGTHFHTSRCVNMKVHEH